MKLFVVGFLVVVIAQAALCEPFLGAEVLAGRDILEGNTEIVAEREIRPCHRCGRTIERIEESCNCHKPLVFESKLAPVHFEEASQHINIPAGPAKIARTRPTYLKKGRSTYIQPRVVLTRQSPIVLTKTITSLQQPRIKKVFTERVSRHPGVTRVIDEKIDRDISFNREAEIVSDVGFGQRLTPVGRAELEIVRPHHHHNHAEIDIVRPHHHEHAEIDIVRPHHRHHEHAEIDIVRSCPHHHHHREEVDILESPRRELELVGERREVDFLNGGRFGTEIDVLERPHLDVIERSRPCGCNVNREIIVNEGFRNDGLFGRERVVEERELL